MATPSYGANAWIGVGEETTWGTAVARAKFFEIISGAIRAEKQIGFSRASRLLDPQRKFTARERAAGDLELELFYVGVPALLLKHLLGDVVTSTLTVGESYRHEIARAIALPTGLSIETEMDQQNFLAVGCNIAQAVFALAPGQVPSATFSIAGRSVSDNTGSESSPTFPADRPLLPDEASVTIGGVDYSTSISSITITIGNSLDAERARMDSRFVKPPVRSGDRPDITISIEAEHDDATDALVSAFLNGTEQEVTIEYLSATSIGASADKYRMKLEFPKCVHLNTFPEVRDPGILPLSIELQALAAAAADFDNNSGQTGGVKITVDNDEATL